MRDTAHNPSFAERASETKTPAADATISIERHFRTEHLGADLKARSLRGGYITFATQGIKFVLNITSLAVLAHLLTPESFGVVAMVATVTGVVSRVKDLGLSMATVQQQEVSHSQVSTLFWINVVLSLVLFMIVVSLAPVIAWFYAEPRLFAIGLALAPSVLADGLGAQHFALLQRQMRFKSLAVRDLIAQGMVVAVGIFLASIGAGYWALVGMHLTLSVTSTIALWRATEWRPGRPGPLANVRHMIGFGGQLTASNIVSFFSQSIDQLVVGYAFGASGLGFYSRAQRLLLMPIEQLLPPITGVATPALCRLVDQPERYRSAFSFLFGKCAFISAYVSLCLCITADRVVRVLMGPTWDKSGLLLAILSPVVFCSFPVALGSLALTTQGKAKALLRWQCLSLAIIVGGIAVGVPWGLNGLTICYVLGGCLLRVPLFLWYVTRHTPITRRDIFAPLTPFLVGSLVAGAFGLTVHHWARGVSPVLGIALLLPLITAFYIAIVLMFPLGAQTIRESLSVAGDFRRILAESILMRRRKVA